MRYVVCPSAVHLVAGQAEAAEANRVAAIVVSADGAVSVARTVASRHVADRQRGAAAEVYVTAGVGPRSLAAVPERATGVGRAVVVHVRRAPMLDGATGVAGEGLVDAEDVVGSLSIAVRCVGRPVTFVVVGKRLAVSQ